MNSLLLYGPALGHNLFFSLSESSTLHAGLGTITEGKMSDRETRCSIFKYIFHSFLTFLLIFITNTKRLSLSKKMILVARRSACLQSRCRISVSGRLSDCNNLSGSNSLTNQILNKIIII
jgi:hypothetical protein